MNLRADSFDVASLKFDVGSDINHNNFWLNTKM